MINNRVVITGMGVITPIGQSVDTFWNNLINGTSGIGPVERFDATDFSTSIAAQVKDFSVQDYLPRKDARRMDLFVQYACAAAKMAVEDASLDMKRELTNRVGVWIGSGIGGIDTLEKQHNAYLSKGVTGISPFFIPMLIPNMAAGQVSIMLGAQGPNGCTVTACASGSNSIGEAFQLIQNGKADVMITGGSEASITPLGMGGFCAMKAMSSSNDSPQEACRPFDLHRNGFVMGEGSGILVLEALEHALDRGANIYAEVLGYGSSADATHMVQPDIEGNGAALAFKMALQTAGLEPADIDYINAHGTGTKLNDLMETTAIKKTFAEHSYQLSVSSIKAHTGHTLGAAGAIELITTTLALRHQQIPPTLNLTTADPECDLDYVPLTTKKKAIQYALSDSLGFGGHNAALIIGAYK
ncbi:MAG: beta-ketoacyl-ACP synthase II [Bacillota bacterium]|nr:beta-ketoacyl-ACP synthase II [Bacillota bacterium]